MKNPFQLFACFVGCLLFALALGSNEFLAKICSALGLYLVSS